MAYHINVIDVPCAACGVLALFLLFFVRKGKQSILKEMDYTTVPDEEARSVVVFRQ